MTHSSDQKRAPPLAALPEFRPEDPPEMRVAVWEQLVLADADVPESLLDAALVKLLEEIRHSL